MADLSSKFAVKCFIEDPPNRKRVATLPWEIRVQEIAMLKNCVNKLARKTQTATHFKLWWDL